MHLGPFATVGEPAQGQLEQHVAGQNHRHHQCRDTNSKAMTGGIHRHQRQDHRIKEGEEQHAHTQRRCDAKEARQRETLPALFSVLNVIIRHGQHNTDQRQAIAGRDHCAYPHALRPDQRQHGWAEHLKAGEGGGIQRHNLATVMLRAQLIDP
ncbi:hypothetical protein D3C79_752240 [compost metagenome]